MKLARIRLILSQQREVVSYFSRNEFITEAASLEGSWSIEAIPVQKLPSCEIARNDFFSLLLMTAFHHGRMKHVGTTTFLELISSLSKHDNIYVVPVSDGKRGTERILLSIFLSCAALKLHDDGCSKFSLMVSIFAAFFAALACGDKM